MIVSPCWFTWYCGEKILTSTFKLKLTLFENSRFRGNENNNGDSEKDKYKIYMPKAYFISRYK